MLTIAPGLCSMLDYRLDLALLKQTRGSSVVKKLLSLFSLLVLSLWTAQAQAQFSQLVVFGDSLADNGNVFAATGNPPPPYFQGVFSNGPVWADLVAQSLGIPQVNLAHGGALTGLTNVGNPPNPTGGTGSIFDVGPLPGVLAQLNTYIGTAGQADPNALYVIFAGGNDFLQLSRDPALLGAYGATIGLDPLSPSFAGDIGLRILLDGLDNLTSLSPLVFQGGATLIPAGAVPQLYQLGARNIMVVGLPDLSVTPSVLGIEAVAPGTQANFLGIVENYNSFLAGRLATLRQVFPDLNLMSFDAAGLQRELLADPASFGFTNTTDSCIDVLCFLDPTMDPNEFLFYDSIHPTGPVHAIFADRIETAAVMATAAFTPGTPAPAAPAGFSGSGSGGPLLLLGLLFLFALRRRP